MEGEEGGVTPGSRPILTLKKPMQVILPPELRPKPAPPTPQAKPKASATPPKPKAQTPPTPPEAKASVIAAIEAIRAAYPAAFGQPIRPLAIGAGNTVLAGLTGRVSRKSLRAALVVWTSSPAYHLALKEKGARRENLDGSDAGPVTNEREKR
jgi:hypothetical protein